MASVTYYADSATGNDSNSGTSENNAWKTLDKINEAVFAPGDKILLKSGCEWNGTLCPKGSGTEKAFITISSYGEGGLPRIDGKGNVKYGVKLENVSYWEIENLEITNNSSTEGDRIGVAIFCEKDSFHHYHLNNLFIHDIMGRYSFEAIGKNTGGIGIFCNKDAVIDDILIENCRIGDLVRVGIFSSSDALKPTGKRPITNFVIRKNEIYRCAGDGAIIRNAKHPVIEYNTAYENHNGPQNKVKYGVALWCRSTDEAVFQYNHVYATKGDMDGQAFDSDLDTYNTVVQHNYTHDNDGGFMLVYGTSYNSLVRNNISRNDGAIGKRVFQFPACTSPRGSGKFLNNAIYLSRGNSAAIIDGAIETSEFQNNLFSSEGGGSLIKMVSDKELLPLLSHNFYAGFTPENVDRYDKDPVIITDFPLDAGSSIHK